MYKMHCSCNMTMLPTVGNINLKTKCTQILLIGRKHVEIKNSCKLESEIDLK